jgi:hypothetical protein
MQIDSREELRNELRGAVKELRECYGDHLRALQLADSLPRELIRENASMLALERLFKALERLSDLEFRVQQAQLFSP